MDYPNHVGNGVYELSDGERVRGKQAAIESESALVPKRTLDNVFEDLEALEVSEGVQELFQEACTLLSPKVSDAPTIPKDYKGPTCPKCGEYRVRQLSAGREAAESLEPSHRKAVGVKMLPALYACPCGKRWEAVK